MIAPVVTVGVTALHCTAWPLARSSDRLHVPIIRRSTVGSRTFTASGAAVWNDLPCRLTSQLRRHSRSSDSALRHNSVLALIPWHCQSTYTNYVFFSTTAWT